MRVDVGRVGGMIEDSVVLNGVAVDGARVDHDV